MVFGVSGSNGAAYLRFDKIQDGSWRACWNDGAVARNRCVSWAFLFHDAGCVDMLLWSGRPCKQASLSGLTPLHSPRNIKARFVRVWIVSLLIIKFVHKIHTFNIKLFHPPKIDFSFPPKLTMAHLSPSVDRDIRPWLQYFATVPVINCLMFCTAAFTSTYSSRLFVVTVLSAS